MISKKPDPALVAILVNRELSRLSSQVKTLEKHFIPGVTDCLDDFGNNVLPKYRDAFKRRYEADGNLSVEAQSQLLKAQYALIPNRRDPYRHEEMKRRGLLTDDGIVPMGVKEALALIDREEAQAAQPAKRGVMAWVADRLRRR